MRLNFSCLCLFLSLGLYQLSLLAFQDAQSQVQLQKLTSDHLPNLIQVTEEVYSGGSPEGDVGFEALKKLGVRTIISVDGAKPDVETAQKFGLRYVHLPHGYDAISLSRSKEIAKAIKTLDGPVYIHCHHGKHRSPAATAAACRTLGWISIAQSQQLLKLAGTDPKYKGLFRSVEQVSKIGEEELRQLEVSFTSSAELPPMASAMVQIEEHFEELKKQRLNKWQSVPREKYSPQQSALLLHESFKELLRIDDERIKAADFIRICKSSEEAAEQVERLLRETRPASALNTKQVDEELDKAILVIESDCKRCHDSIRNR